MLIDGTVLGNVSGVGGVLQRENFLVPLSPLFLPPLFSLSPSPSPSFSLSSGFLPLLGASRCEEQLCSKKKIVKKDFVTLYDDCNFPEMKFCICVTRSRERLR